jgi:hypothetical protein
MTSTKGLYLEFVGPSGIGKSTCLEHFKNHAAGSWNFNSAVPAGLTTQETERFDGNIHWDLWQKKADFVQNLATSGLSKIKLMLHFNHVLHNDLLIFNQPHDQGFFLDEGLCHNFSLQLNALTDGLFTSIMHGRALVFLIAEHPETVVERLRKRQRETGFMVPHHIGLNDAGLRDLTVRNQENYERLSWRVKSLDLPCCTLFAEYSKEEKIARLSEFEQEVLHAHAANGNK